MRLFRALCATLGALLIVSTLPSGAYAADGSVDTVRDIRPDQGRPARRHADDHRSVADDERVGRQALRR